MLLSGVALAGANKPGGPGIFYALEIQSLNLEGTELVILSACDTAKGDTDYAEGGVHPKTETLNYGQF